nr:Mrp/NBP35 family ATP-binding protein [Anaerolineae bacterium]
MSTGISKSQIHRALSQVKHPEHEDKSIVELEMIPQIEVDGDQVTVKLALPFPNVQIAGDLMDRIHQAIGSLDGNLQVQIDTVQMEPEKKAAFMSRILGRESAAPRPRIRQVVGVMSGKGGVGKSSIAGLLAAALQRDGNQVGVLDADITGPSIPKLFGAHQQPESSLQGILPVESRTGIRLMSINLLLHDEGQPVVWRGPLIGRAIEQFWRDIVWGELDYLIIDLPPGTSDAALTVSQILPVKGFIMVMSPQDLAGMVVRKAAHMATQLGIPLIGLVENMSHIVCPECGAVINVFGPSRAQETAQQIGAELLGRMPLDPDLAVLCDAGQIEDYRSDAFDEISRSIQTRFGQPGA